MVPIGVFLFFRRCDVLKCQSAGALYFVRRDILKCKSTVYFCSERYFKFLLGSVTIFCEVRFFKLPIGSAFFLLVGVFQMLISNVLIFCLIFPKSNNSLSAEPK